MKLHAAHLIVTDLDDTLLRSDKTISDYTVKVLEQCRIRGSTICYATARAEEACNAFIARFSPDVEIFNNGSLVCAKEGVLFETVIAKSLAESLNEALTALPSITRITAATSEGYFISFMPQNSVEANTYQKASRLDFTAPPSGRTYKYTVEIHDTLDVCRLSQTFPILRITRLSRGSWYTIPNCEAGKWPAVKAIANRLGILEADIYAFGDDLVDIEMLRCSGKGIAMVNALSEVQVVADMCCGSNNEDGVAQWLDAHFL